MFFSQVRFETGVVFPLSPKAVYKPKAATSPSPGSGRKKKGRPRVIRDIEDTDAADVVDVVDIVDVADAVNGDAGAGEDITTRLLTASTTKSKSSRASRGSFKTPSKSIQVIFFSS